MDPSQLQCPRCQHWLFAGHTHNHPVFGCGHCGGVWLDAATSARVVQTACQATVQLSQSAAHARSAKVDTSSQHNLACPVCRHAMQTTRVQKAWLDIDVCQAHGVWYDAGELERVARTAHQQAGDWRSMPQPDGNHNAALAAGAGVAGAAGIGYAVNNFVGNEVVQDVAGEVLVEGIFAVIGAFFE